MTELMVEYSGNAKTVTMSDSSGLDNTATGDYWYPNYWDTHTNYYHHWYPSIPIPQKNRVEQAFKIMEKLMEKKIVERLSLKKFIELVNEIAKII